MRKDKKLGFTGEQHVQFGKQLAGMQAIIDRAIIDLSYVYRANGRELPAAERASRAIERLRAVMDDAVLRERPKIDGLLIDVYYPREPMPEGSRILDDADPPPTDAEPAR